MIKQLVFSFLLLVLVNSVAFNADTVSLEIKVNEIQDDGIQCDFKYSIWLSQNDSVDYYILPLPFDENESTGFSLITVNPNLYFTYGANNLGQGIAIVNSVKDSVRFNVEFSNILIPYSNALNNQKGLILYLTVYPEGLQFVDYFNTTSVLHTNRIEIQTEVILDSNPRFELSEKGAGFYNIKLLPQNRIIYFKIPSLPETYLATFLIFLFISLLLGFVSGLFLIKGRRNSIIGLVSGSVFLIIMALLFYYKIMPTEFKENIDMINLIGGGCGLASGLVLTSIINLIKINTIKRLQGKGKSKNTKEQS